MTEYTHLLDEVPVGTVVRAADGTIAARYDHQRGVIFGDDRPFPWEVLQAPAVVLWPRDECIDVDHLERQAEWSARTFGPGRRTKGLIDHITKELAEIEADPDDISEWADLIILAFDGAWRHGHSAADIIHAIKDKQAANETRTWPDWRGRSEDEAIEHERKPRCYIAGPIASAPDFRARFAAAVPVVEALGYDPVNPCDITPAAHEGECPPGYGPGEEGEHTSSACFMRADLRALLDCDAIFMLPGWRESRGATTEHAVAVACGIPVLEEGTSTP